MVKFSYGDDGKYLSKRWHNIRELARTTTFSIDEWSEIDQSRYDLDEVEFTRQQKQSSYVTEARVEAEGASKGGRDWSDDPEGGK